MKTYTLISKDGDAWSLMERIKQEGNHAIVYINNKEKRGVGDGIVEKSKAEGVLLSDSGKLNDEVLSRVLHPNPDCIIMDMVGSGFGTLADRLRKSYPVIGGSEWADKIELDRPYGAKVMKAMGINTPKTYTFTDYTETIKFVEDTQGVFVYKPSGNQSTTTTYVSRGPEDMIGMLDYYSDIKEEFELQEKVEGGVEISSELWFNGSEVINVNHTMEEKPLMEGGKGPKAGCMGSVVWLGSTESKLFKHGVGRLVDALKKLDYRGPVDLNSIVTKDKVYGLEFTPRFGYDALFVLLEMYKGKVSDLLYGVASGSLRKMEFKVELGMGIDLCVPPYPLHSDPDMYKGVLIQGISEENKRHLWLYDVQKVGDRYLCAGCGGDIGAVTARGDKIGTFSPLRDAHRRVMRTISNLVIPDVMYREDIGSRVQNEVKQLQDWGWL